ncbi:biotin synthase BioB [Thioflexithrix psekupsensis]|uniref:Biotin synthase n=1 Tax=Thioflexithrix psekupsensis TaxID=1570016 RepID=A0A251XBB0_9GAMM|nr:biotin synthase BioB [Thioflexithrix psekupsensis]OUD15588.1 biotin synthase BioB [Thioflexithrix psekupsensis]
MISINDLTPNRFPIRHDWQLQEILDLFALPFNDLLFYAQCVHRSYFPANQVQLSTLFNIKTGRCPEDCAYCSQSVRFDTAVESTDLADFTDILAAAYQAKANGATRFCMGAAWRQPKDRDLPQIVALIQAVKALELETCVTLGMLNPNQAHALKAAGLDYYNHNLDTSAAYYEQIVSTHTYTDRLTTLNHVRDAGIKICCGGIIGLGENETDRAELLRTLANLPQHPESVPINRLVKIEGTPLANAEAVSELDFVRTIAVARILLPASFVRLSAGRAEMTEECQALCFLAGANSVFYGDKLLTTANSEMNQDQQLFDRLGMEMYP